MPHPGEIERHDNGAYTRYRPNGAFTDYLHTGEKRSFIRPNELFSTWSVFADNEVGLHYSAGLRIDSPTNATTSASLASGDRRCRYFTAEYDQNGNLEDLTILLDNRETNSMGDVPVDTLERDKYFTQRDFGENVVTMAEILIDHPDLNAQYGVHIGGENVDKIHQRVSIILGDQVPGEVIDRVVELIITQMPLGIEGEFDEDLPKAIVNFLTDHYGAIYQLLEINTHIRLASEDKVIFTNSLSGDFGFQEPLEDIEGQFGEEIHLWGVYRIIVNKEDDYTICTFLIDGKQIKVGLPNHVDINKLYQTIVDSSHDGGWEKALELIHGEVIE